MKILITSDNHLGYKEKDSIRKNDSFITFEEILRIARERNADFVINGGDLFDENTPSRNTYSKAMKLLNHYCIGDSKDSDKNNACCSDGALCCSDDALCCSDDALCCDKNNACCDKNNACCDKPAIEAEPIYNWNSRNMGIVLPIFGIHGNHDDPSGFNTISPMDILSCAGYVNYIGKCNDIENIRIEPVLIRKGSCKVALYGLGYLKDRRLYDAFLKGRVSFQRTPPGESYYNIFVLHQNRTYRENKTHNEKEYIPESLIPAFFDLVIYGHEHESMRIKGPHFDVIQCGSSVRTSLCAGETGPKYAYLLTLDAESVHVESIELATVRPLVFDTIVSSDDVNIKNKLLEMIRGAAAGQKTMHHMRDSVSVKEGWFDRDTILYPLLRLRIDASVITPNVHTNVITPDVHINDVNRHGISDVNRHGISDVNKHSILEYLKGKIANVSDALRIVIKKEKRIDRKRVERSSVDIFGMYGEKLKESRLGIVGVQGALESLMDFIYKGDKDVFYKMVNREIDVVVESVPVEDTLIDEADRVLREVREVIGRGEAENTANAMSDGECIIVSGDAVTANGDAITANGDAITANGDAITANGDETAYFTFVEEKEKEEKNIEIIKKTRQNEEDNGDEDLMNFSEFL